MSADPPLIRHLPPAPDETALLDGFTAFADELGLELYEAQEEAIFELLAGSHVILNTPTGSGKSMVAAAAHYAALAADRRSVYTAPIKALVSEKFFALCRDFGSERVGMITGDAAVNPDAPIICCTAEILANWALRDGPETDVDVVIVDEFHYYGDPQRGWAWQLPLLELPHVQFLLMSATLGDTTFLRDDLEHRTGRPVSLVASSQRPVPLDFEYRRTTLHASIEELLESGRAPIYLVHFTQREATEAAQGYLSLDPLTKDEKAQIRELIGGFRFDSPIGKDLKRYLLGGVGVHHAGLLPKYRLLVEKLAQAGLLKIICGTDTLGVGVNVPIRSVLFTQLCKYDGEQVRILRNREFAQIAGRAGRKGFDDRGDVWVQAPPHVVENLRAEEKAAKAGKKKVVKKKPPERGYAHWTEDTFNKIVNGEPEAMRSHFTVTHQMVMNLLDRPVMNGVDGCGAVRRLMTSNHEPRRRQRQHIRRSIAIYRSLVDAELLEFPDEPDEFGRRVRVNFDLQDEFALHQPLSLWALEALEQLAAQRADPSLIPFLGDAPTSPIDELDQDRDDREDLDDRGWAVAEPANELDDPAAVTAAERAATETAEAEMAAYVSGTAKRSDVEYALDMVTIIESILESPGVVIAAQVNQLKSELMADMKMRGIEYDERMERLREVEPPRPNKRWLYNSFDAFRVHHPWVGTDNVRPKSVVRDLFELGMTFGEYVNHYGLKRSEGVVLRYLSDVYKALVQNVPAALRTDELDDIAEWLGALIRQVDSSLIDEWERLQSPDGDLTEPDPLRPPSGDSDLITDNVRAFRVMVRNEIFAWVQEAARHKVARVLDRCAEHSEITDPLELVAALQPYWDEFDTIETAGDARSPERFIFEADTGRVTQILLDPEATDEWRFVAEVDNHASNELGRAVLRLVSLGPV